MSRFRRFAVIAAALLCVGALIWFTWHLRVVVPYQQLRSAAGEVQLAIERYAVDTQGSYPQRLDLEELQGRGYLVAIPLNPYSGKPMRVLSPDNPPQPGDLKYFPCGPIIAVGGDSADTDAIYPSEVDQYTLIAYGTGYRTKSVTLCGYDPFGKGSIVSWYLPSFNCFAETDLEHMASKFETKVAVILMAGESYDPRN